MNKHESVLPLFVVKGNKITAEKPYIVYGKGTVKRVFFYSVYLLKKSDKWDKKYVIMKLKFA